MKKILIILIAVILVALIAFSGWYFFLRIPNVPIGETVRKALPFGSGDNAQLPTANVKQPTAKIDDPQIVAKTNLFQISAEPVAGAVVLNRGASTGSTSSPQATIVRYVDRATGHIYDIDLTTRTKTKISNQTLPKIYEAYFRADGNSVLLRSLKDNSDVVENVTITLTPPKLPSTDTLYTATSTTLRKDMGDIAVGLGNALFYTLRDPSSIVMSAFNGTGVKTLFNSPFSNWRLSSAGNILIAYTKASADIAGYAYAVNTSGGALAKILGPLNGLIAIPNTSNSRVLYSYIENGQTKIFAKNLKSNALTEILPNTLAEKCVWSIKDADTVFCAVPTNSPGTGEPDSWYMGQTHFSDRIWLFDTKVSIARVLVEPRVILDVDIDAMELKLSSNEDYLIFINKTDLSLWVLKLEQF